MKRSPLSAVRCSLLLAVMALALGACAGKSVTGDPEVDEILVRTAVGAAMDLRPELVLPAYAGSDAVLARLNGDSIVPIGVVESVVEKEIGKLGLMPSTRDGLLGIVALVKKRIIERLETDGIVDPAQRRIIVLEFVRMVHEQAAMRLRGGLQGRARSGGGDTALVDYQSAVAAKRAALAALGRDPENAEELQRAYVTADKAEDRAMWRLIDSAIDQAAARADAELGL